MDPRLRGDDRYFDLPLFVIPAQAEIHFTYLEKVDGCSFLNEQKRLTDGAKSALSD